MATENNIKAILFDFGGVIAEEGFKQGLRTIASKNELDSDNFLSTAFEIIYDIGFVLGKVREEVFWNVMRKRFALKGNDEELSEEILSRFILRPWMLDVASHLKKGGILTGILSDQCHWLDELDRRHGFFAKFDHIFNSYHIHISKKDPALFDMVSREIEIRPENILFVDDHEGHLRRAQGRGFRTILYVDKRSFLHQLAKTIPWTHKFEKGLQPQNGSPGPAKGIKSL